jgi:hypothetical protein
MGSAGVFIGIYLVAAAIGLYVQYLIFTAAVKKGTSEINLMLYALLKIEGTKSPEAAKLVERAKSTLDGN